MDSSLTLHDFVINLLSDADARAAFDIDPHGALDEAGLTGVTPADVQDLMPLVADYAPSNVSGLHHSLPEFSTSTLGVDRIGAVHPLTLASSSLPLTGSAGDLTLATASGLGGAGIGAAGLTGGVVPALGGGLGLSGTGFTGDAGFSGHAGFAGGSASFSGGTDAAGSSDFSPAHDLSGTLDAALTDPTATSLLDSVDDTLGGALGGPDGGLDANGLGTDLLGTDPLGGDPFGANPLGDLHGTAGGALDGATHGLSGPLDTGHVLNHTGLPDHVHSGLSSLDTGTGLPSGVHSGLPSLDSAGSLLPGSSPLGVSGSADTSSSSHTDAHLLDLPHLF
jgi:hypothetical protein